MKTLNLEGMEKIEGGSCTSISIASSIFSILGPWTAGIGYVLAGVGYAIAGTCYAGGFSGGTGSGGISGGGDNLLHVQ